MVQKSFEAALSHFSILLVTLSCINALADDKRNISPAAQNHRGQDNRKSK